MDVDSPENEAQVPSLLSEELSGSTLAALQEFLIDRKNAESVADPFAENWGMSQFWYDSETAATVAAEVLTLTDNGVLPSVCIACPSLFRELKVSSSFLVLSFGSKQIWIPIVVLPGVTRCKRKCYISSKREILIMILTRAS